MTTTSSAMGLEYLSVSQIIRSHMVEGFTPEQERLAKEVVAYKIREGEKHLRELCTMFSRRFLNSRTPEIAKFTNYYDYLRFIYDQRTHLVDDVVPYLDDERKAHIMRYDKLNPCSRNFDSGTKSELEKMPNLIEIAYSGSIRTARVVIIRRKSMDRTIRKIAYRQLELEIDKRKTPKHGLKKVGTPIIPKRVDIDDIFGGKIVTSRELQARTTLFNIVYPHLHKFLLKPYFTQELIETTEGTITQLPGVDNHYLDINKKRSNLIQLKVLGIDDDKRGLREIALTDMVNFLAGEMDHVKWNASRENKAKKKRKKHRKDEKRFEELVRRGHEVLELVPKEEERKRVLLPEEYFYDRI